MNQTIEFSKSKDRLNVRAHDISLARAVDFDFDTALEAIDDSQDYGEQRWIALGFLAGKLYVLVYVSLSERHLRIISLRKATKAEELLYAEH
jgi:uncharacterized DUF497 family protein